MYLRIRHIVLAFAAAALVLAGCNERYVAESGTDVINFSASTVKLETSTKSGGTLDERTAFAVDDAISVYGWHHRASELVFNGQTVTKTVADPVDPTDPVEPWDYAPKKKWRWQDSDYYDFLAVPDGVSATPASVEPFSLSVSYDATDIQYDLLMAGVRHKISDPNPSRVVDFKFQHMLCAVKVIFYKYTGGEAIVVSSYHFRDLIVSADIEGYWDDGYKKFDSRLANTLRLDSEVFGEDRIEPWNSTYLTNSTVPYDPDFFDLLPPQDLNPDSGTPSLVVRYMDDTVNPETSLPNEYTSPLIPLKDIPVKGTTDQFITRWEAGHKYIYEVHILYNGGVLVNVITTEWDPVDAQTPGLMI